jgi:hypothetical protein
MQLFLKNAEVKLVEALSVLHEPAGWQALHFHLGQLMEEYKSEYQFNIATNLIHDLLKTHEGGIFLLADQSIVVLCFGLEKTLQNKIIFQMRYLYMDDPLAYNDDGGENPEFCHAYDLRTDWQEFWNLGSRRMAVTARKGTAPVQKNDNDATPESDNWRPQRAGNKNNLSATSLASIERDLQYADLSKVIRRQAICAVLPNTPIRHVLDELYINITHLRQVLRAEVDFLSNRSLFKYLTQLLDQRMIEFIRNNPRYMDSAVSINLNAETLLSSTFADFDAMLRPDVKVSMVIEVPVMDAFANMEGFMLARREAQKKGYRVCLDGLTSQSLMQVNRVKLGVDLLKLQWNADRESDLGTLENKELMQAVRDCGTNRIILCRCDKLAAVEYGQALGISLFQGRYIDSLVAPNSRVEN